MLDHDQLPLDIKSQLEVDQNGCWVWNGRLDGGGYGVYYTPPKIYRKIHRVVWELLIGQIPSKLTLDHLCYVRNCANPEHLEAVTLKENILRGNGPAAKNLRKIQCPKGHPYDRVYKNGFTPNGRPKITRICGTCKNGRKSV